MSPLHRVRFTFMAALLVPAASAAQQPLLRVSVDTSAGSTPVVYVGGVLGEPAIDEALRSGLPVRLDFLVELWRDELFDDLTGSQGWTAVLLYEPLSQRYVFQTNGAEPERRVYASLAGARAALERSYALPLRPPRAGRYYYTATVQVETLSLSDLEELNRWMRGELQPAVAGERPLPSALGAGVERLLVRLLGLPAARLEARSPRFRIR